MSNDQHYLVKSWIKLTQTQINNKDTKLKPNYSILIITLLGQLHQTKPHDEINRTHIKPHTIITRHKTKTRN